MSEHQCGDRVCIWCNAPAESPTLPVCMEHDLHRLTEGFTARAVGDLAAVHGRCRRCGCRLN